MPHDFADDLSVLIQPVAWLGAVRQPAITPDMFDPDICRHMTHMATMSWISNNLVNDLMDNMN